MGGARTLDADAYILDITVVRGWRRCRSPPPDTSQVQPNLIAQCLCSSSIWLSSERQPRSYGARSLRRGISACPHMERSYGSRPATKHSGLARYVRHVRVFAQHRAFCRRRSAPRHSGQGPQNCGRHNRPPTKLLVSASYLKLLLLAFGLSSIQALGPPGARLRQRAATHKIARRASLPYSICPYPVKACRHSGQAENASGPATRIDCRRLRSDRTPP